MCSMQLAQEYFDAWNDHDAPRIVATLAPGGTYIDPTTPGPLTGEAVGDYAAGLWSAFPDLCFELTSATPTGENSLAAQWIMRGTNNGSMFGLPPTGKSVELPGADFIDLNSQGIQSVTGYFDTALLPRQLGLQVVVQPDQAGPFAFGLSTAIQNGHNGTAHATPGALSFTSLYLREPAERELVLNYSRQIGPEMLQMQGFISFLGMTVGQRMLTLSAWESPDDPLQLMRGGTHKEAVRHLYTEGHYLGGVTSVWVPLRTSYLARCSSCGKMHRQNQPITHCACGASLTIPADIW